VAVQELERGLNGGLGWRAECSSEGLLADSSINEAPRPPANRTIAVFQGGKWPGGVVATASGGLLGSTSPLLIEKVHHGFDR
jgi:hypothetical protein